ncbi:MAG: hypothetical protein PVH87_06705 [Desulfobacteraceae bacterium]|jgi:hypothetical protein
MAKTIEGVEISGYGHQALAQDLEMYCDLSAAAKEHLQTAGRAGAKVEVRRAGKICHAELTVVKVARDACCESNTGLTSPVFLVESVLFELQNAINSKKYQKLKREAKNGQISVLQYGLGVSKLEFESTAKLVSILTQIKAGGRPISPWGQEQFRGYARGPVSFANGPHDRKAVGEQRLPSRLFYAYSYLQDQVKEVKNMKLAALKKLATIRKGTRSIRPLEWGQLVAKWGTRYAAKKPAGFLVAYVDALLWLGNELDWSVNWEGGTQMEWKQCTTEFVRLIPGLQHDRQATETIKQSIERARFT